MISEEKQIEGFKNRRVRILAYVLGIVASSIVLVFTSRTVISGTRTLQGLSDQTKSMSQEQLLTSLPDILATQSDLMLTISQTYATSLVWASLLGVCIATLLLDAFGYTTHKLVVRLWERVERLEKSANDPPSGDRKGSPPSEP